MINDPQFGPQFDPSDGTVGHIQLVKRWGLTSLGLVWPNPKAVFMYDDQEEAEQHLELLKETRPADIPFDLQVVGWWCWPTTKCPAYRVSNEQDER